MTKNGTPQWILVGVLTLFFGVIGWNIRGIAGEVTLNSTHRIAQGATEGYHDEELAEQGKEICWLKNSVRAIHDEQVVSRDVLNRIADKVGAAEAPRVEPLPAEEMP